MANRRDISVEESRARQRLALYLLLLEGVCPALAASRVNETYGSSWTLAGVKQFMDTGCPLNPFCNELRGLGANPGKAK
jgi:hypothetical protein